jgi:sugar/nucleoside kinase (ribokinase family)
MVFVVGAVAIDVVAIRERFLEGTSNPSDIRLGLGGVGYRIFSNLEAPRRFVTALGVDPIEEDGNVRIQEVTGREAGPPLYLALMESGSLKVGASDFRIVEESLSEDFVTRAIGDPGETDFLVLDANLSTGLLARLVSRYAARTRVVFEPVSVEKARRHLAALRHLCLTTPTSEELDALCPGDVQRFVSERSIDAVLVTRGEAGTRLYHGGSVTDFEPRVVVKARDTTGAGDQLLASLVSLLHEGRVLAEAVRGAMDRVEQRLQGEPS